VPVFRKFQGKHKQLTKTKHWLIICKY
jgi:hypothetical protein